MPDPVSQRELARRLEVSPAYVNRLVKPGVLPLDADGKIDGETALAKIAAARDPARDYMREVNEAQRARHRGTPAPAADATALSAARLRQAAAGARLRELQVRQREGELVELKAVQAAARGLGAAIVQALQAIPDRLASEIGRDDEQRGQIRRRLHEEFNRVRAAIARDVYAGRVPSAPDAKE